MKLGHRQRITKRRRNLVGIDRMCQTAVGGHDTLAMILIREEILKRACCIRWVHSLA